MKLREGKVIGGCKQGWLSWLTVPLNLIGKRKKPSKWWRIVLRKWYIGLMECMFGGSKTDLNDRIRGHTFILNLGPSMQWRLLKNVDNV